MSGRVKISSDHQTTSANIFQVNMADMELFLFLAWNGDQQFILLAHIFIGITQIILVLHSLWIH